MAGGEGVGGGRRGGASAGGWPGAGGAAGGGGGGEGGAGVLAAGPGALQHSAAGTSERGTQIFVKLGDEILDNGYIRYQWFRPFLRIKIYLNRLSFFSQFLRKCT